ncbi:MAG: hypothetical protein Q9191_004414 [Dirinaria sp. TL-2023a]
MNHNQPGESWQPSGLDPRLFQIQKRRSKAVTIKPPSDQGKTTSLPSRPRKTIIKPFSAEGLNGTAASNNSTDPEHSKVNDSTVLSKRQPRADRVASVSKTEALSGSAAENPRRVQLSAPIDNIQRSSPEGIQGHVHDRSVVAINERPFSASANANGHNAHHRSGTGLGSPEENTISVIPSKDQQAISAWKPDVFAQAFVPRSYLLVNDAPARSVISQAVEGINFPKYVLTFATPLFLPPMFSLTQSLTISRLGLLRSDNFGPQDYKRHFIDCVMLDLEAQLREVRSYDIFGAELEIIDFQQHLFSLHVPGLRESAPRVAFGDIMSLRQLVLDPWTKKPLGMEYWEKSGGQMRGEPAPGFTGSEITGTVVAVIKQYEKLHLRLAGVLPIPLVFNVSFVVQRRRVHALERTIADIAHELTSDPFRDVHREQAALSYPVHSSDDSKISRDDNHHDGLDRATALTSQPINITPEAIDHKHWLHHMLFPTVADGVLQTSLPKGRFQENWFDKDLNYEQMKAVTAIHSRNYGDLCYLINGPPGTGKTKTVVETAAQFADKMMNDKDSVGSILLCAPSDPAADTLALRLSAYFDPQIIFRLNEFSRTFAEVPEELLTYCHIEDNIFSLPPLPRLMSYKIVITTCRGADVLINARVTNRDLASLQTNMLRILHPSSELQRSIPLHWTALLVDEAAQATEPEVLIPLAVIAPHAGHPYHPNPAFVMAGDQHQLGPRTYDRSTALHVSLFERLSNRSIYASHPKARKWANRRNSYIPSVRPPFVDLVRNYRSHPAILAVPSSLFYHNSLIPEASNVESLSAWGGWSIRRWPILFACNGGIDDCEDVRTVGGGWYNMREANRAIRYAANLLKSFSGALSQSEICIMSPFHAQVHWLRNIARAASLWELNIGPMEAFQGLESRVVIICTTRTRTRFLREDASRGIGIVDEPKKFNVALTRAKEGLIVLGNPWVLSQDPHWLAFLKFCWRNELWSNDEEGQDPRMPEGREANANSWKPLEQDGAPDEVAGLEAALLYKEREPSSAMTATRRFLSTSQDDEMWTSGMMATQALPSEDED